MYGIICIYTYIGKHIIPYIYVCSHQLQSGKIQVDIFLLALLGRSMSCCSDHVNRWSPWILLRSPAKFIIWICLIEYP